MRDLRVPGVTSIYAICRSDGVARYVGRTSESVERRAQKHLASKLTDIGVWMRSNRWTVEVLEVVADGVDPAERERAWIERRRAEGCPLVNVWPHPPRPKGAVRGWDRDRCGLCYTKATEEVIAHCLAAGGRCLTGARGQIVNMPCPKVKDEA